MLRSLGAKVNQHTKFYRDNKSVCISIIADESLCKKKHTVIAFHQMREAAAAEIIYPCYVILDENSSDFLTKAIGWDKHNSVTNRILKYPNPAQGMSRDNI